MKKLLSIISVALVIATLACILCSCGSKKKLVGTWAESGSRYAMSITFNSDGKGEADGDEFTYKVSGKKLKMTLADGTGRNKMTFKYTVKNDVLTLSGNGRKIELYKVKTDEKSLVGKWKNDDVNYTFGSGGKGSYEYSSYYYGDVTQDFTYRVNNGEVKIIFSDYSETYKIKIINDELVLSYADGYGETRLTRVK